MRILLWWTIAITFVFAAESNVFSEYRKKRAEEKAKRVKKPMVERKLSQKKEDIEWRQSRIKDSMDRLDALLAEGKSHESRNSSAELRSKVNLTAIINENRIHREDDQMSLLETGSRTKFAGALLGAAANLLFSRTTMCVMCSYILEMVDRQVKASPRWANGGGGFFPGQVDFSPGENQGFFRTYPGGYLEISESSPIGSGVPEPPRNQAARNIAASLEKHKLSIENSESPKQPASDMRLQEKKQAAQPEYAPPTSKFGAGTANGMDQEEALSGRKVRIGRFTPRDYDRVDSQSEKSMEYQQMFKDMMDALDEVCFKDLPEEYAQYCSLPFNNGEALVEFYLHDYEDWEICTKIYSCLQGFYDDI